VLRELLDGWAPVPAILHAAPEEKIRALLSARTRQYVSIDRASGLSSYSGGLSAAADLTRLAFRPQSFDLVLASHVLEHIHEDHAAVREIHRVLRPGGVAVLPVPIVHDGPTVEYDEPRPSGEMHVRAPGLDYFRRFERVSFEVVVAQSSDYPDEYQLRSYHADRSGVLRSSSTRRGYEQYVPICRK